MTTCYREYILRLESNISSNPKLFWFFIKDKRKCRSRFPAQMSFEHETVYGGSDICNLFSKNFASVYNTDDLSGSRLYSIESKTNDFLSSIKFKDDQVLKVLKRLDHFKGAGTDGLPSVFAAKCASALAHPLCLIYNKSLSTGVFPSIWKVALVVPLLKNGDVELVKNYRPISILPVLAKTFEQLIYPYLSWHLKALINLHQHGFVKAKSTATNLVSFINDVSQILDKRSSVDAVYTDFSKAFDRVNHQILVNKLSAHGIAGSLLSWCESYLTCRYSRVVANGYSSELYQCKSGVPQGSHLGPLFFNVFINDINSCFYHSEFYLYADDLKLFKKVDNASESTLLQEDLERLCSWCNVNGMTLNVSKCFFIRFSRRFTELSTSYAINGDALLRVDGIMDLGIFLDNKLRFNVHIDTITSKAFQRLGFVLRNCKDFKSPKTKIVLFNSLVRSGLEYCSVVWNPFYDIYKKNLERIQKRFLWHLTYACFKGKSLLSYEDRLDYFKMRSLEDRRYLLDNVFLYKLANGLLDAPELLASIRFSAPSRLPRGSGFKLFHADCCSTNLGLNAPLNRMIRQYNSVSKGNGDVDLFHDTLHRFKKSIFKSK